MNRSWFNWSAGLAIVVALTTSGCDQSSPLEAPVAPAGTVAPQNGLIGDLLGGAKSPFKLISTGDGTGLTLENLLAVKIIGPAGGSISLQGHTLTVPAGAVSGPTVFTMIAILQGRVEVDLTATVFTLLGRIIDVGELGFAKPVTLSLSYANVPNLGDPNRLIIVHIDGNTVTPLPSTVNPTKKTVSAKLPHFSKYAMATN